MKISKSRRLLALIAVALAGCASGKSEAPSAKVALCDYDKKSTDVFFVSHINYRGAMMQDDVNLDEFRDKGFDSIPSAIAQPKKARYVADQRKDCYDEAGKFYYPCKVKVDVDLGPAIGISRATDMKTARFYAIHNCERITTKIAAAALKSGMFEASGLECQVTEEQFCPVPKK